MSKQQQHAPTTLANSLEHVMYEIWKHKQSVAYYQQILQAGGDAALEFRTLHTRVLLEFFYGPAKHADNIVAWEYISNWKHTHDRKTIPWLDGYMLRCHTMLAHISKTRSEMAARGLKNWATEWSVVDPHLSQTISDFLGGLSAEHKNICREWITTWLKGSYQGNVVLKDLLQTL